METMANMGIAASPGCRKFLIRQVCSGGATRVDMGLPGVTAAQDPYVWTLTWGLDAHRGHLVVKDAIRCVGGGERHP